MGETYGILISATVGLLVYSIGAAGSAALSFLWLPRLARDAGVLLASLVMPAIAGAALLALYLVERGGPSPGDFLTLLAFVCIPGVVVGWPSAFLTLRALEHRIERAGIRASEIFE